MIARLNGWKILIILAIPRLQVIGDHEFGNVVDAALHPCLSKLYSQAWRTISMLKHLECTDDGLLNEVALSLSGADCSFAPFIVTGTTNPQPLAHFKH